MNYLNQNIGYLVTSLNIGTSVFELSSAKLMPDRPTRKFQVPMLMEDPGKELKAAKAERLERFRAVEPSPIDNAAEADRLAERKKKRQEESKLAEERY